MSRLNYSKWDALELSDDSDVEVHPNVDKKSFIRWKQRDIHEKREARKQKIANLQTEIAMNDVLADRLSELTAKTDSEGPSFFSRTVDQMQASRDKKAAGGSSAGDKPTDAPGQPTYDEMVLSLLLQVREEVKGKEGDGDAKLGGELVKRLKDHEAKLAERQAAIKQELKEEEEEQKKHITSEDIKVGWDSSHVTKIESEPEPVEKKKVKGKTKTTETSIETLNPGASAQPKQSADSGEESDDELPVASSAMLDFAHLPFFKPNDPDSFTPALKFIADHKGILTEDSTDALLLEAFNAQMRGDEKLARGCVEKGLLVQYCRKLGKDGVSLFFKRMTAGDGKAVQVFLQDVNQTYQRIVERSKVLAAEQGEAGSGAGAEQIQLVAEDPSTVISFEVPDGPPPEEIQLEGEGAENMDVEQVRAFLQKRWDIFQSFPEDFRKALETKELEEVNKVLGKMSVDEAEQKVQLLDEAGILSFSSTEIKDETGK